MVDVSVQRDSARGSFLYESTDLRFSSPLFAALSRSCATDPDIVNLASVIRPGQPIAIFVLLSAQYLVFRTPDSPLAAYFPSLTDRPKPAEQAFPEFREFCLDRREELLELLATRTVNTNLVERASSILPASQYVFALTGQPLTLVEICCSAGLNLLFDEYHYDYGGAGRTGDEDSAVRLTCKFIGGTAPVIGAIPRVQQRTGIDLVTVDCTDPDARVWMEAMLFPEWRVERSRLRHALALQAARKARTLRGDALTALPPLLEEFSGPLMVLHSFCMGQWSSSAQLKLDGILREASRYRDIHRIGMETPDGEGPATIRSRLAALSAARMSIQQKSLAARIEHTLYRKTKANAPRLLGHTDGLGSWIDWKAADPATHAAPIEPHLNVG